MSDRSFDSNNDDIADIVESPTVETIPIDNTTENVESFHDNNTNSNINVQEDEITSPLLLVSNDTTGVIESTHHNDAANQSIAIKFSNATKSWAQIYSENPTSCLALIKGLLLPALLGIIFGIIMPKNTSLPSPTYRYISSILGYTYFVAWSVSFYPQIITNYKTKSTAGISTDSSILAVLNYICYTIYNVFFFWDETIRQEYKDRNGDDSEITVMSNDVAFAVNALLTTTFILGQILYYKGWASQPPSKTCLAIVFCTMVLSGVHVLCILFKVQGFLWIDFLYMMGTVKLILTIMTYIPQVTLNFKRKSTSGEKKNQIVIFICILIFHINTDIHFHVV
jgi:uncharacterized protein with PQ loop repeat